MKRIFTTYTLARSGHHAVAYWLFAHFENSTYVNDPFLKKEPLTNQFVYGPHNPPPSVFDLSDRLANKTNVFTGLPDQPLAGSLVTCKEPFEEIRVILIRDPFNLFASRMKHSNIWEYRKSPSKILPLWKEHAREFLGMTDVVKIRKIPISYNEWFKSYTYRQSITDQLQGDKVPGISVLEHVSSWGFGSSFDDSSYQGRAGQMKVLDRWKEYQNNKLYMSFFDEETVELSREIFGSKFVDPISKMLNLR